MNARGPVSALTFSIICAVAGGLASAFASHLLESQVVLTTVAGFIGCFLTGGALWRLAFRLLVAHGAVMGAVIGFVVAIVAPFVSVSLFVLVGVIDASFQVKTTAVAQPFDSLSMVPLLGVMALVVAGPIAVPAGVITAAICARIVPGPKVAT